MSYDESDAQYDRYMDSLYEDFRASARDELYDELYDEIINDFATSRLQAFYLANPMLVQSSLAALAEARVLASNHPRAAVVFAVAATEVCFKAALLKPIFYGLVHAESSAELLMELAIAPKEQRLGQTMRKILAIHGGVDLHSFKRLGSTQAIWQEMQALAERRNAVLHRCESASHNEAAQAIGVAEAMIEVIFPATIARLGLHLHKGFQVCDATNCPDPRI